MLTLRVDERVHCMTVFIKGKLFASKPNQKWVRKKTLCADYKCCLNVLRYMVFNALAMIRLVLFYV
jgi:hypothetical protein